MPTVFDDVTAISGNEKNNCPHPSDICDQPVRKMSEITPHIQLFDISIGRLPPKKSFSV